VLETVEVAAAGEEPGETCREPDDRLEILQLDEVADERQAGLIGDGIPRRAGQERLDHPDRLEQELRARDAGAGQLAAELGVGEGLRRRLDEHLREPEKVALDRRGLGIRSPEFDEIRHALERLPALPEQFAYARILEVAGLDQAAPDDRG